MLRTPPEHALRSVRSTVLFLTTACVDERMTRALRPAVWLEDSDGQKRFLASNLRASGTLTRVYTREAFIAVVNPARVNWGLSWICTGQKAGLFDVSTKTWDLIHANTRMKEACLEKNDARKDSIGSRNAKLITSLEEGSSIF